MTNNLLSGLNDKQIEAVVTCERPLRIIAGAGSGKTKVITTKIAYLISELNIPAWKILAVTFTNKAAKEMKERVVKITGEQKNSPFISTFHSFCCRVLREDFVAAGLTKDFLIIDTADQQQIIKKIIKNFGFENEKDIKKQFRQIVSKISNWKNSLIDPTEARAKSFYPDEINAAKVYSEYELQLKTNNQVDFDDLQLYVHKIFNENKEVLQKWQNRFDYVLVDEFQDTNELQFDLIKFLTKEKQNLTVVGDPDQTIYSWRGAQMEIILNFEKVYSNSKTVILNQNYRSTQQILDIANDFIDHNENRVKKDIFTDNTSGEKVQVKEAETRYGEAKSIANEIQQLVKEEKYNYSDFFILYRINAWSQEFEKVFSNAKIPFRLIGGIKFRDRKVIKDAMAFLKTVAVKDNLSMERILNLTPKVGSVTIDKILTLAEQNKMRIFDLITNEDETLINSVTKNLKELREVLIEGLKLFQQNNSIETILRYLLVQSGYEQRLKSSSENEDDLENIKAFYDQLNQFDLSFEIENYGEENKLLAFLQEEALISEENDSSNNNPNQVTLLTIHSAKGLENKVVYIVGVNKDVFPSSRSSFSKADLEEERRAFYVALTRAQEKLTISYVRGEFSYISGKELSQSKFITELNKDMYKFEGNIFINASGKTESFKFDNGFKNNNINNPYKSNNKYEIGDLVSHMVFGDGVVTKIFDNQLQIVFSNPKYGTLKLLENNPILKKK